MREGNRFAIHILLFLVGVSSSQMSVSWRKSQVLVSKVLTGISGTETQIMYD